MSRNRSTLSALDLNLGGINLPNVPFTVSFDKSARDALTQTAIILAVGAVLTAVIASRQQ